MENTRFIPLAQKQEEGQATQLKRSADMPVKPFLKWAGGKSQVLDSIRTKYPKGIGTKITKYAEPLVGGGAVLFDILERYKTSDVYISDINRELIQTYISIRDNIDEMICSLQSIERNYINSSEGTRKEIYYSLRDRFNVLKSLKSESVELSALFIFLNKTCFNGLYRVNSRGLFNVPQGSYKNPTICDTYNLQVVSAKLQNVTIVCRDYKESKNFIDSKTLAYFDPPYRPLSPTASFTSYTEGNFGDKEQIELAAFINDMSNRNAWIIASNSDPKNINSEDDFFDRLYSHYKINRINASRAINSKGALRGKVSELLIVSY